MRVLIVKTSSMGDLIHTLPAVTDAYRAIPGIQFDWLAEESFQQIPGWHPAVRNVIPVAMRRWRKNISQAVSEGEIRKFWKLVRSREYDRIIDAQGLLKSAVLTRVARGLRYGMDRYSCKEPIASCLYQKRIPVQKGLHAIERVRRLFAAVLNYQYAHQNVDYGLDRSLFKNQAPQQDYLVFLHATSRESKLWPVENWVALAGMAHEQGYQILLPWGNEQEHKRAEAISDQAGNVRVLPQLTLAGIAEKLANAQGIIGVDTGLAHLGAAFNVPGVTLYTATSPALTGAMGAEQTCLSSFMNDTVCVKNKNNFGTDYIKVLTPELVWGSMKKKLP